MPPAKQNTYETRILRVIDHIHDHATEPLSLDDLADVACFSRFHFHRVFRGMTGQTVAEAIRNARLNRATGMLRAEHSVAEVALACGYMDATSFSRAFSTAFGIPPARFREAHAALRTRLRDPEETDAFPVEIRDVPGMTGIGLNHVGSYMEIGNGFEKLSAILGARGLFPRTRAMLGLYFHDPSAVDEPKLQSIAAVVMDGPVDLPDGCISVDVPAARHAVMTFWGHYSGLNAAYGWLYGTWLPRHDVIPADRPVMELYLNSPRDVPPDELLTEIHLPLT